jgi:hypothetical protein
MRELIRAAIAAWARTSGVARRTQTKRMAHLEVLVGPGAHRITPKSVGVRLPAARRARTLWPIDSEDDQGTEPGVSCLDPAPTVESELPESALAEGEGPIDYASMAFRRVAAEGDEGERSVGTRRDWWQGDPATMARLGFLHDPSTAQLFEYADVYAHWFAQPPERLRGEQVASALYWSLVMLHGLGPDVLARLQAGRGPREDCPVLDVEAGTLWMRLPRVGYTGTLSTSSAAASRPGSEWASVPLLPWLHGLARRLRAGDGSAVFGAMIAARQEVSTRRLAARLARSTRRWLQARGLPTVIADLVAGRFSFSTLATSAYVNLSNQQVHDLHRTAALAFHTEILEECRHRGLHLRHLEDPALFTSDQVHARSFGSRIVPLVNPLQTAITALDAQQRPVRVERPLSDVARAWNAAALAAWIRLLWATALRPCRDPMVTRDRFDPEGNWLLVEDKNSPYSHEVRPVPLPPGEGKRLAELRALGDRVRFRLRSTTQIDLGAVPEHALFFVIVDHRATLLTPALAREVLIQEGLANYFAWPFNAARHFWLTRALEQKIPLEAIEPFIGHSHEPMPWGPFSLGAIEPSAEIVRRFGTAILRETGFDGR